MSPARVWTSANRSSKPQASVSDSLLISCLDPVFDRDLLGRQVHLGPLLRTFDDAAERSDQAEEIDFDLRLGRLAGNLA